jgi:hypothetical protein
MLPVANPNVIFKALSDGAVLFSTEDEVYYGLNEVGARVWELLPPACATLDEMCAALAGTYPDVDEATIRADVAELLEDLLAHRLLTLRPDAPSNGQRAETPSQADRPESARVG